MTADRLNGMTNQMKEEEMKYSFAAALKTCPNISFWPTTGMLLIP
jgi:hypothetical protein